ncbi:hypothetical protein CB1_001951022 [Camelus ferus]|nr:hypothetical protein CB1_001951022 [Camelus ferus]
MLDLKSALPHQSLERQMRSPHLFTCSTSIDSLRCEDGSGSLHKAGCSFRVSPPPPTRELAPPWDRALPSIRQFLCKTSQEPFWTLLPCLTATPSPRSRSR